MTMGESVTPNQTNAEGAFKGATAGKKLLPNFVAAQFAEDPDLSWRELERRILVETNAQCIVSHTTLPIWYGHLKPDAAGEESETSDAVAS